VLQLINEFLPVRELAGRLIGVPVLRQFGLVESERVDISWPQLSVKKREPANGSLNGPEGKHVRGKTEVHGRDRPRNNLRFKDAKESTNAGGGESFRRI